MRPHVPFLDTKAMDWQPCEVPGLFTKMLSRDAETQWAALLRRLTAQYALDNQHQPIVTQCYLEDPAAHIRKLANDREYAGNAMLLSHTWNLLWIVGSRGFCLPIFDHTILSLQSDNFG